MNISTESWHYKLINSYSPRKGMPKSLCMYFWYLVGYLLITVLGVVLTGAIATLLFGGVIVPAIALSGWVEPSEWMSMFFLVGFFEVVFLAYQLLKLIYRKGKAYYSRKWGGKEPNTKEPNVLVEFLKAKKNKVCPTITYKD